MQEMAAAARAMETPGDNVEENARKFAMLEQTWRAHNEKLRRQSAKRAQLGSGGVVGGAEQGAKEEEANADPHSAREQTLENFFRARAWWWQSGGEK